MIFIIGNPPESPFRKGGFNILNIINKKYKPLFLKEGLGEITK